MQLQEASGGDLKMSSPWGLRRSIFGWVALIMAVSINLMTFDAGARANEIMRFIVGAAAGGAIDNYIRVVADPLARSLGKTAMVESKPGANGNIAAQYVLEGPPDGNTIWVGSQSMLEINPSVYTDLRWSLKDFAPIIKGVESPLVLVTNPSVAARTLSELVEWLKRNPGNLGYASFGVGSSSHFLGQQFNDQFELDLAHIAYRGTGPQTTDLLAGHVRLGFTQLQSALPHIQAGSLNAIAITSTARSSFLPDVATFSELGYPAFSTTVWYGLFARAATPANNLEGLLNAANKVHKAADVVGRLESSGFTVSGIAGAQFRDDIQAQMLKWARLVRATGLKPQ